MISRILPVACGALGMAAVTLLNATSSEGSRPSDAPELSELQIAYEQEATGDNAKKHDLNLKLTNATCHPTEPMGFACSVSFFSEKDPDQTLYFDIARVEPTDRGWRLKSGLCRK